MDLEKLVYAIDTESDFDKKMTDKLLTDLSKVDLFKEFLKFFIAFSFLFQPRAFKIPKNPIIPRFFFVDMFLFAILVLMCVYLRGLYLSPNINNILHALEMGVAAYDFAFKLLLLCH